ncbi:hypothetical protein FQN60_006273 [Etheostoma spectabile]|uniref:Uncharacterized protein n=1 Tax=Etheostoma spectabile TaxID=54343 RepID=A0A5J5CL08_9PERO|nr:hypothetical protein FQN60_006273 [Etheostoma spectabile]
MSEVEVLVCQCAAFLQSSFHSCLEPESPFAMPSASLASLPSAGFTGPLSVFTGPPSVFTCRSGAEGHSSPYHTNSPVDALRITRKDVENDEGQDLQSSPSVLHRAPGQQLSEYTRLCVFILEKRMSMKDSLLPPSTCFHTQQAEEAPFHAHRVTATYEERESKEAVECVGFPSCVLPAVSFHYRRVRFNNLLDIFLQEQTNRATHTGMPAWEARLAWQAVSVHQSGRPFMRLHESAGNNDKLLIIRNQADLLPNPTP